MLDSNTMLRSFCITEIDWRVNEGCLLKFLVGFTLTPVRQQGLSPITNSGEAATVSESAVS